MNRELLMLVDAISREKNVERDVVFGAVELALASATNTFNSFVSIVFSTSTTRSKAFCTPKTLGLASNKKNGLVPFQALALIMQFRGFKYRTPDHQ